MQHTCEESNCNENADQYTYPLLRDQHKPTAINLCAEHAQQSGFCPGCASFVGGIDDPAWFEHGICSECLEELRIETGEYDHYDEVGYPMDAPY